MFFCEFNKLFDNCFHKYLSYSTYPLLELGTNDYPFSYKHSHKNGKMLHLCCTFMVGHYPKAYRTTKMASGKDYFFYEDDLDTALPIIDADMFENDEDMESYIVTCIKNLPS